jgi:hypothetical protein
MRLPLGVLEGTTDEANSLLGAFLDDLAENRLRAWREQIPTFVRIDFDGVDVTADLYRFTGRGVQRVADGPLPQGEPC